MEGLFNKKAVICILLFSMLISISYAQESLPVYSINAYYKIYSNNSVLESLKFVFSPALNESTIYTLDKNITDLYVVADQGLANYSLIDNGNTYTLNITVNDSISFLNISYISNEDVFNKDNVNLFLIDFLFDKIIQKMIVTVDLPQGYLIYQEQYTPADAMISTNGEMISLGWVYTLVKSSTFSLQYFKPELQIDLPPPPIIVEIPYINYSKQIIIVLASIAFIMFIWLMILPIYFKKKTKEEFLVGFREDEVKAIQYIQKHKNIWQNKLIQVFNFSRAKTTRIVKKLVSKGLLRKEEYGRTNKLFWLKK